MSDLNEIRARADAATEGPWCVRDCPPCTERGRLEVNVWDHTGNFLITSWCDDDEFHRPDAEFIAHARTDIPKLVRTIGYVQAALADMAMNNPEWISIEGRAMILAAIEVGMGDD